MINLGTRLVVHKPGAFFRLPRVVRKITQIRRVHALRIRQTQALVEPPHLNPHREFSLTIRKASC